MPTLNGRCHCGALTVQVTLPQTPADYAPRACDCSFCQKHGAAYLSDPAGRLAIAARGEALVTYRQGSGTAEMLLCGCCGVLIGAVYRAAGRVHGAVNVRALDDAPAFAPAQTVSPHTLSADEKTARWSRLWFADVTIETGAV